MTAKTFARGDKKKLAIKIIEENLDKDFFETANLISIALDLNKYAGRAYYKYMIKHGLISKYQPTDTPWKTAKAEKALGPKREKAAKAKAEKAKKEPVKKVKPSKEPTPVATDAPGTEVKIEKPATSMIRDFIKKQKAAKAAA